MCLEPATPVNLSLAQAVLLSVVSGGLGTALTLLWENGQRAIARTKADEAREARRAALVDLLDTELMMAWFDMNGVFRPPGDRRFPLITGVWDSVKTELPGLITKDQLRKVAFAYYQIEQVRFVCRNAQWTGLTDADVEQIEFQLEVSGYALDAIADAIECLGVSPRPVGKLEETTCPGDR